MELAGNIQNPKERADRVGSSVNENAETETDICTLNCLCQSTLASEKDKTLKQGDVMCHSHYYCSAVSHSICLFEYCAKIPHTNKQIT